MGKWTWLILFFVSVALGVIYLRYSGSKKPTEDAASSPITNPAIPSPEDPPLGAIPPSHSQGSSPLSGEITPRQATPPAPLQPHQPQPVNPVPNYEQPTYEPPPPPPPAQNFPEQSEPFNPPPFEPGVPDEDFQQAIPPPPPPPMDEDY